MIENEKGLECDCGEEIPRKLFYAMIHEDKNIKFICKKCGKKKILYKEKRVVK